MKHTRNGLVCLVVFAALSWAGIDRVQDYRDKVVGEQRLLLKEIVDAQAKSIERRLSRALLAASFLAIEVQRRPGELHDFEQLAQAIIDFIGGVTNLQLAPGGVISDIYPLQGHEAALGLDILSHRTSAADARRAIDQRQLSLAGPYELVQGGLGILGRHPVFVTDNGVESFWGFSSVLITLDDLLADLGPVALAEQGYAFELSQIDSSSGQPKVFASSKMPLTGLSYRTSIPLADTTWELEVSRDSEVISWLDRLGYLVVLLVAGLVAGALFLLLRQNEILAEAKAGAEQANRERNAFMISMSHEVRTPLTGLMGLCHLMKRSALNVDQKRYIDAASTTVNQLLTVINDLLDISRIDGDDFVLESVDFEIVDLVEEVASVAASAAQNKSVDLVCDLDHRLPHLIKGDPQRLRQVLNNLLGDAIVQAGRGQVLIYAHRLDGQIEFGVDITPLNVAADNDDAAAATQAEDSIASGHGKMINRRWIEAMGSELRVERQPGGETRYRFHLDIDTGRADAFDWNPPDAMRDFSICVLSPNQARRQSLLRSLHHWEIDRAEERAFDPETDEPPPDANPCDLVIIDQVESKEKVSEFIEKLRNVAAWREARFIQLLPQGAGSDGCSADLYLHKPVMQGKLYGALMEMLYRISLDSEFGQRAVDSPASEDKPLTGSRLLLAEDNDINKIVALEILEETGAEVDVAVNGVEAVAMATATQYDLILMDIQMPKMDGYEASRQIRALGEHYAKVPIIAMTAHAQDGERGKSVDAGMDQHVSKPFDPEQLLRIVIERVRKREPS